MRTSQLTKLPRDVFLSLALGVSAFNANAVELITNGDFETGTLAGWTTSVFPTSFSGSNYFVDDVDGFTPFSGQPTVGPAGGSFYAVGDEVGPSGMTLTQTFAVPLGATSIGLTFDMFINDFDQGPLDNGTFDATLPQPNQFGLVDILLAGSSPFDRGAGVLTTLVAPTVDGGPTPNPYTAYAFDLAGILSPGMSYDLRFGSSMSVFFLNQGIDNVSIMANVPEPATLALLTLGLAGIGFATKKKQSKH